MKNLVNYLDEFIEDDLNECANKRIKQDINKKNKKLRKKILYEDENQNNEQSYNKIFKHKDKHKK